jgi:PAS domain S-box-containing protein
MVKLVSSPLRILHLEDDWRDAELVRRMLMSEGLAREVRCVETGDAFQEALESETFDLILSDYTLPGFDGMRALQTARERQPHAPFIFVSGTIDEELAVESLKCGATDYVFKNRLSRLGPAVRRALQDLAKNDEARRAEESMRQSEHKYRRLFESLGDAAFLTDVATGRILDTNKQGEMLLGRTRSAIIGQNQARFQTPDKFEQQRRQFAEGDEVSALDCQDEITRNDGAHIPVSIRVTPLVLYGRKLMIGLFRDITQYKRAEERIEAQARLLDLDPDAILVRDMEDRIQYWNEGAARLYGWQRDEVLGRTATLFLYPDRAEFDAAKQAVIEHGSWTGELHQVTREGQDFVVHSRWTLLRDENGRPKSILLVNTCLDFAFADRNRSA